MTSSSVNRRNRSQIIIGGMEIMKKHAHASKISGFILITYLFALIACSTMTITGQWKDQNYKGGPFKKYIVIGLFKKLTARQTIEDAISDALKRNGVDAISSLTILTPDRELKRNDKDLDNFLHMLGIDGILIVKLSGMQKSEKYVQGSTYYSAVPGVPFGDPYMSYYYNYYQPVSTPGYYEDFVSVMVECSLFANSNNKLIWKAEAHSIPYDQGSKELIAPKKTARDLANIIITNFLKDGFIAVK